MWNTFSVLLIVPCKCCPWIIIFRHLCIQLRCLPVPVNCRLVYSVVTAVHRGWISHSFPRPIIAGKGYTLYFSQRGYHGSSHAQCYQSWRPYNSVLNNCSVTTTLSATSRILVYPLLFRGGWYPSASGYSWLIFLLSWKWNTANCRKLDKDLI